MARKMAMEMFVWCHCKNVANVRASCQRTCLTSSTIIDFFKDFTKTNDPFLHYWLNVDVVQQHHFTTYLITSSVLLTRRHEVCILQRWENEGGEWSRRVPCLQGSRFLMFPCFTAFWSAHSTKGINLKLKLGSQHIFFQHLFFFEKFFSIYSDFLHFSRRVDTLQEVCWFWIL